jgi:CRP/FNR family cyclic AMP-dependent transcriptional regulator
VVTKESFDSAAFLRRSSSGRVLVDMKPRDVFFTQGDATGSTFYLMTGRAKLTVVSDRGKEMILALLSPGDFLGEESLAPSTHSHRTTAVAVTHCTAIRIEQKEMAAAIHAE